MLRPSMGRRVTRVGAATLLAAAGFLTGGPTGASAASPSSVVIGVDHSDPANQTPQNGRLFEYTDFFSRSVSVHRGEVVDFQTAPFSFHIIALAKDETLARRTYPVAFNDVSDPNAPNGGPKIGLGPSNFPITGGSVTMPGLGQVDFTRPNGPPVCGTGLPVPDCVFSGGSDVEVAGPNLAFGPTGPVPADWNVKIDAAPGTYHFFCYIHPHMSGTLRVVGNGEGDENGSEDGGSPSTQAQIDAASARQFTADRAAALRAEAQAGKVRHSEGTPGHRTYFVKVGVSAADDHVAIDEMFPNLLAGNSLALSKGDRVVYQWKDDHNVHSVFFPAIPPPGPSVDVAPFGFECADGSYMPAGSGPPCSPAPESELSSPPFNPPFELIADPGNAAPGTLLTNQSTIVDSGVLVGTGYGLHPSVQQWWVRTGANTAGGAPYLFHCTIHDFMVGGFTVA